MKVFSILAAVIVFSACSKRDNTHISPPPHSCPQWIMNGDDDYMPNRCQQTAIEFARLYFKEHPEVVK